jgi:Alternative oxidase
VAPSLGDGAREPDLKAVNVPRTSAAGPVPAGSGDTARLAVTGRTVCPGVAGGEGPHRTDHPAPDGVAQRGAEPAAHHALQDLSDRFALVVTKRLRFIAEALFAKRYGHRAIVLETVATVPGRVGATISHLRPRRLVGYDGWIRTSMDQADNERMHLVTYIEIASRHWKLAEGGTLADMVCAVRSDEARHRDVNYGLASALVHAPPMDAGRG